MSYNISAYCRIASNTIWRNQEVLLSEDGVDSLEFFKSAYKFLKVKYPKFYKMDALSKLAFLAAEVLLGSPLSEVKNQDVALLFSSRSGSLDTDIKHQNSISDVDNYYPSPAVFVYTLSNICLGEVSIRHGLQSEHSFFISEEYPSDLLFASTEYLLQTDAATKVVCGWIELVGEDYECMLYVIEKEGDITHTKDNINLIFNK